MIFDGLSIVRREIAAHTLLSLPIVATGLPLPIAAAGLSLRRTPCVSTALLRE
jgi:hypothetical protein